MEERILNLLNLCMEAKKKGIDCFFEYAPHTEKVDIRSYEYGWNSSAISDKAFYFYMDGTRGEEEEAILTEAETYLKGLIEYVKLKID